MKLILAPMATLTHQALRKTVANFGGVDEYYTEMINASSLLHGGQFEKYYILNDVEPEKTVWQLTGDEENPLAEAAAVVKDCGGIGIDINMGCAAPAIYKYGAGISWMLKPVSETSSMLGKVKNAIGEKRLSVKIRLGDEDFTMEKLFAFADMLVGEGVSQIVLHPRTKKEKYTRPPKYNLLNEFCQYVKENHAGVSVIGNGGVRDVASYRKLLSIAPNLDGIMIGRAAVEKPWIFAELKKSEKVFEAAGEELETEIDLYQVAEGFLEDLCKFQPKEFYPTRAKRFFEYFIDNFFFGHSLKAKIQNTDEKSEQLTLLKEYLERNPQERYKRVRV